jgi:arsenate reductase
MTKRLKLLFLCTGNACRSQMAEGWTRALRGDVIEPHSAGLVAHGLDARAVAVMAEVGVDISTQSSKSVDQLESRDFDWVITVCGHADAHCPTFGGDARRMHFGFDDPPGLTRDAQSEQEALACYRRVRDEIKTFVLTLPDALSSTQ